MFLMPGANAVLRLASFSGKSSCLFLVIWKKEKLIFDLAVPGQGECKWRPLHAILYLWEWCTSNAAVPASGLESMKKRKLSCTVCVYKLVHPFWKIPWHVPKMLKIKLSCGLAISPVGTYQKNTEMLTQKVILTPVLITTLFTTANAMEVPLKSW